MKKRFKKRVNILEKQNINEYNIKKNLTFKSLNHSNISKYNKNIHLPDINKEIFKNLNNNYNDFCIGDENLTRTLKEVQYSVNELKEKLNMLKKENINMNKNINILKLSNNDLNNKFFTLNEENDENNGFLNDELITDYISKKINQNNEFQYLDKNKKKKHKILFMSQNKKFKNKKNNLVLKQNKLKIRNKASNGNFSIENTYLKIKGKKGKELKNENKIIKNLKMKINFLKNNLNDYEEEKNEMKKELDKEKIINDNKIYDLSRIIEKLNNENEKLNDNIIKNKRLNFKLNKDKNILINEIKKLSKDLYQLNLNTKNMKIIRKNKNNIINSNNLKYENICLKQLIDIFRKMTNYLFNFLNELNNLNYHPEIDTEQCYNNLSLLIENINKLKNDIIILVENEDIYNDNN